MNKHVFLVREYAHMDAVRDRWDGRGRVWCVVARCPLAGYRIWAAFISREEAEEYARNVASRRGLDVEYQPFGSYKECGQE